MAAPSPMFVFVEGGDRSMAPAKRTPPPPPPPPKGNASLFTDEELKDIMDVRRAEGFVEVTCGCTSYRLGDAVGKLRVYANGDLFIKCDCTPGCEEDNLTPAAFEKHTEKENGGRWKQTVWVTYTNGKKVPLLRTVLLKYYNKATSINSPRYQFHRDEFITCTDCKKDRRFRLRSIDECRIYHDAFRQANWKCSDMLFDDITCEDDEERPSRIVLRGCPRAAKCKGCTQCVCFGCLLCRFSDCQCNTCVDFIKNADI